MVETSAKLWAIVRREYVERVRTKWFIYSTLFAPLIFAGFVFLPLLLMSRDAKSVTPRVLILDATQKGLGNLVARSIAVVQSTQEEASTADVRVVQPDSLSIARDSATSEVAHRLATGFVVLDSTTLRGDSVDYAGRRADSRSDRVAMATAIRAGLVGLRLQASGLSTGAVDSVMSAPLPALHAESINDAGRDTSTPAKSIVATFVAFFLYMSILLYGQSMLSGVIEEKMSRVSEIVISSVKPETLLAGKVIGVTAVGLTQQIVWIGGTIALVSARALLFGAPAVAKAQAAGAAGGFGSADMLAAVVATPWSWVIAVLLFLLLGILFYGSLYAAVGATVGSEQDARQAATPVVMLIVLTALLISPTVSNPTSQLALVTSLLPFSSPIIMPIRMALTNVPVIQVVGSLVILAASCLGAVWLAGRIYRVGLLMYGKRPTFKELRRWIFAS
ncbi:MAG TPA: ABC transporter permease [Gemmatimonadaceae bacterium]|mgnify:CR=1 FL=1|jgi:ABC-2 type transport system permease protein